MEFVLYHDTDYVCFRPLTGILFFNERHNLLRHKLFIVSVPLRGFCFSTLFAKSTYIDNVSQSFRPLTGILFFNLREGTEVSSPKGIVSVPLRGFCFSTVTPEEFNKAELLVSFRPLTGILFFNVENPDYEMSSWIDGFRPLTGILFFNALNAVANSSPSDGVSVPLRGFCFSTGGHHAVQVPPP